MTGPFPRSPTFMTIDEPFRSTVYLRYFESARVAYFERVGFFPRAEGSPIGAILASIDFVMADVDR